MGLGLKRFSKNPVPISGFNVELNKLLNSRPVIGHPLSKLNKSFNSTLNKYSP